MRNRSICGALPTPRLATGRSSDDRLGRARVRYRSAPPPPPQPAPGRVAQPAQRISPSHPLGGGVPVIGPRGAPPPHARAAGTPAWPAAVCLVVPPRPGPPADDEVVHGPLPSGADP